MSKSKSIDFHVELKTYRHKVYATSLHVAEDFGKRHDNLLRIIERLIDDLNQLSFDFNESGTHLNFEASDFFNKTSYIDSTGRKLPLYDITRKGFELLVMGFTGTKALKWKLAYQARFEEMETMLTRIATNQSNESWQQARLFGKQIHNEKYREAIKALWVHAQAQGSKSDQDKFHQCYGNMLKNAFGYQDRAALDGKQLAQLSHAELLVSATIRQGIARNMAYKDIFQNAKAIVESCVTELATLIKKA